MPFCFLDVIVIRVQHGFLYVMACMIGTVLQQRNNRSHSTKCRKRLLYDSHSSITLRVLSISGLLEYRPQNQPNIG